MTREEVDLKKELGAQALLLKSGVGGIHAHCTLGTVFLDKVGCLGLAGSTDEAIVKVALQFAFDDGPAFRKFILEQSLTESHKRKFRVVR